MLKRSSSQIFVVKNTIKWDEIQGLSRILLDCAGFSQAIQDFEWNGGSIMFVILRLDQYLQVDDYD